MVIFTPRLQRFRDNLPQPVGVFEDDALLLRLARRSGPVCRAFSPVTGPINSDDLAFEVARQVASATWDL
jgi:hypothetical protein